MNKEDNGIIGHAAASSPNSEQIYRYNQGKTGHGWAAEDANNLNDRLHGKNAQLVGTDNKANGPDRVVNGTEIQTKYCNSARRTVNAAFGNDGYYRYHNRNGNPMILEVPKDQYQDAVKILQEKIRAGKVLRADGSKISDPRQAQQIVKEGSCTYYEAVQIAKGGTVESLLYDLKSGSITCIYAGGISAAIAFVKTKSNGGTTKEAFVQAAKSGGATTLQTAAITTISSQVERQLTQKATEQVAKTVTKTAANTTTKTVITSAVKTNIVTGVVTTAVVSIPDVVKSVKGKQSWTETGKHVAENGASVAGGLAAGTKGAAIGLAVGGPVGAAIGGVAASIAGALATTGAIEGAKKLLQKKKK